jgi:hypothetical protein
MTPPAVYEVVQSEVELLDVSIVIFDANVPVEYDEKIEQLVQPEIRAAEANYMPYFAKNLLQSTGNWGSIRVIPRKTFAFDVIVTGKILHSDGESITLELSVSDASGRQWFADRYEALASRYAYDGSVPADVDPFQTVYRQFSDDLLAYRRTLTSEDIVRIRTISELRYAEDLLPDAFNDYLLLDVESGEMEIQRLPSDLDPNIERIRRLREREYLFIDTLEAHFDLFGRNMYPSYQSWRQATYDEAIAIKQLDKQIRERTIASLAAFASLSGVGHQIDRIDEKKADVAIHAEVLAELGVDAGAEIIPYTLELENESTRLQGNVLQQYNELRKLLKSAYYRDLDLSAPAVENSATEQ